MSEIKVSEHFSRDELVCHCGCGQCIIDNPLIAMAEAFREFIDKPMITHCVNRCVFHNKRVGGAKQSWHIVGKAMDFHVAGMSNKELHKIAKRAWKDKFILTGGLGIYDWGIHIDSAGYRTWKG